MTLSIQQQIDRNREILQQLPIHANFVRVWDPQFLSHSLRIVYEVRDTGMDIQNPEAV